LRFVRFDPVIEHIAHYGSMPPIEIKDTPSHGSSGLLEERHYPACLAKVGEKLNIRHLADFRG
jgi:hypothetical protein